jgi:predicted acetyltransferase
MTDIRTTRYDDGSYFKELYVKDKRVCRVKVFLHKVRIGTARVPTGGIVGLETEREFRNKGYARLMLDDCLSSMRKEQLPLSMLIGIPNMYHKFGYAQTLNRYRLVIPTRTAEEAENHCAARDFRKTDARAIARIYEKNNFLRNISMVRENWAGFRHGSYYSTGSKCKVILDKKNRIAGYAGYDDNEKELVVFELGCTGEAVFPSLLNMLSKLAVRMRLGTVNILLPPDHPFAEYCTRYDCDFHTHHFRNETGMVRITDMRALFTCLKGELGLRIRNSRFKDIRTLLKIKTELGKVLLDIEKGKVSLREIGRKPAVSLSLPQSGLSQLLTGFRSSRDVLAEPGVSLTRGGEEIMNALFPKSHPYLWNADWY